MELGDTPILGFNGVKEYNMSNFKRYLKEAINNVCLPCMREQMNFLPKDDEVSFNDFNDKEHSPRISKDLDGGYPHELPEGAPAHCLTEGGQLNPECMEQEGWLFNNECQCWKYYGFCHGKPCDKPRKGKCSLRQLPCVPPSEGCFRYVPFPMGCEYGDSPWPEDVDTHGDTIGDTI
jgi:hypothetical protein